MLVQCLPVSAKPQLSDRRNAKTFRDDTDSAMSLLNQIGHCIRAGLDVIHGNVGIPDLPVDKLST